MESNIQELARYKHEVHYYLDILWIISCNKVNARNSLYKWLAIQMNKNEVHISQFNLQDCKEALHILKGKYKQLTGNRNISKTIKKKLDNKNNNLSIKQLKRQNKIKNNMNI